MVRWKVNILRGIHKKNSQRDWLRLLSTHAHKANIINPAHTHAVSHVISRAVQLKPTHKTVLRVRQFPTLPADTDINLVRQIPGRSRPHVRVQLGVRCRGLRKFAGTGLGEERPINGRLRQINKVAALAHLARRLAATLSRYWGEPAWMRGVTG